MTIILLIAACPNIKT